MAKRYIIKPFEDIEDEGHVLFFDGADQESSATALQVGGVKFSVEPVVRLPDGKHEKLYPVELTQLILHILGVSNFSIKDHTESELEPLSRAYEALELSPDLTTRQQQNRSARLSLERGLLAPYSRPQITCLSKLPISEEQLAITARVVGEGKDLTAAARHLETDLVPVKDSFEMVRRDLGLHATSATVLVICSQDFPLAPKPD